MLSEEEVRKSFARVKEDILQIKRSLNKQVFSVEEINKTIGNSLEKEEFYAFIKRLGSKIEELENSFPAKSDKEDVDALASELREEIAAFRKILQQRDDIADEVREVRSLKGKVLELEGSAVSRAEFSKDATKLKTELSALKAASTSASSAASSELNLLSSSLSKLNSNLADLGAKLNSLTAKAVVKNDISAFTDRMESSHQETLRDFAALKRDVDKKTAFTSTVEEKLSAFSEKLSESESALAGLHDTVSKKLVDKSTYEKAIGDLRSKMSDAQKLLESSMSEVNLDDYATKRSVKQQFASLSDSLSSSISVASSASSDFSSKLSGVEEQLRSLKSQLDSVQKNLQKQLGKEMQRFAGEKDLGKIREDVKRISSSFVSSDDFYSKFDRLEGTSNKAYDDFKKEIKRQRELFEERLKSLESYYRSSNDTLKAEVDQLRSGIKALSKAGEQAKAEMAKISTSAARVAAKTASDLIEEAEEDAREGRGGKGFSPLMLSVVIIALLIVGSVSYVFLKGGEKAPVQAMENITPPAAKAQPAPSPTQTVVPPVTSKSIPPTSPLQPQQQQVAQPKAPAPVPSNAATNATVATTPKSNTSINASAPAPVVPPKSLSNVSANASAVPKQNASQNVSVNVQAVQNASKPATPPVVAPANASAALNASKTPDKNKECKEKLECKEGAPGEYGFDCYFDNATSQCRCFVGAGENCPGVNASKMAAKANASAANATNMSAMPEKAKSAGARYYGIVAFVVIVVGFFAYRTLFVKEEGDDEKGKKEEKAHEKPKAKEAKEDKESEKAEAGEDDDVIDLEEFFEKKESKKK